MRIIFKINVCELSMSFVCLAVTMVLFISLFLYFRQKILALEEKLKLLSDVTTTMAGITTLHHAPKQNMPPLSPMVPIPVSEEESEEESEAEAEAEAEAESDSDDSVSIEDVYDISPAMTFFHLDNTIKNVVVMRDSVPQLDEAVERLINMPHFEVTTVKKVDLGVDFAPVELASMDLAPVELDSVDMAPVELDSVDLAPVELASVDLAPVDLASVDLAPMELASVDLASVDLAPVELVSKTVDEGLPKRIVSADDVKTLKLDSPYEAMTLKELKEKVAEINGPKLKTKKELMEYLKNKM